MALIMGLSGYRGGPSLMGIRGIGVSAPLRATTLAGLHGAGDIIKAHPLLVILALGIGGYIADRRSEGKPLVPSAWGEQRMSHARAKSLHGPRRRRR